LLIVNYLVDSKLNLNPPVFLLTIYNYQFTIIFSNDLYYTSIGICFCQ